MMKTNFVDAVADGLRTNALVSDGDHVCVCLSGGADSVSLLLALNELKDNFKFNLSAIHINHMIRGDEADRDEQFCVDLCRRLDIRLYVKRINVPQYKAGSGKSLEEAARDCRYSAFYSLKSVSDITVFATAHTASDNAETVLMNIIRGTTVSGLAGIPVKRDCFIRPLLNLYRADVIDYLDEKKQNFVTDSTNLISDCTRNFVRNDVIPMLRTVNGNVDAALNRLSSVAGRDDMYLNSLCDSLDDDNISTLPFSIAFRKIRNAYCSFCGSSLSTKHILEILENIDRKTVISLPNNVCANICYGKVCFSEKYEKTTDDGIYSLEYGQNSFASGKTTVFFGAAVGGADCCVGINMNNIQGRIRYRMRAVGDRLMCKGVNRSVKKEFINNKIPLALRDICPVFFDDKGIIYVPYIGVADRIYTNAEDAPLISVSFAGRQDT